MRIGRDFFTSARPLIMGVLNVTPDSFYDGGRCYQGGHVSLDAALRRVEQMLAEGADIIDVGGESTRPGALAVSEEEECQRVLPVVEAIRRRFDAKVSLDTSCPVVMTEGVRMGAALINDVRALQRDGALAAAAAAAVPVCLMHMQGSPQTMQNKPGYNDAVSEVYEFLAQRKRQCIAAGIAEDHILVDPGIGFGKVDEHNLALIRQLQKFTDLAPVLLGVSRKSMFGRLLGREPEQRLAGSLAVAMLGMQRGVSVVRVHDVAATRDVVAMCGLIDG